MEPAGLALSVVGVAGLVSSFIDFLNYVSAANSRDEEYETIQDLFEFERGKFIEWVQMYNSHGGSREKTRMIRALQSDPLVKRIFVRMERLIANGTEMMERYGLRQLDVSEEKKFKPISRLFPKLYERLARKKNTLPHRVRWVIRDREKFRVLINDMRFLNDRFESLSNRYYKQGHTNLLREELSSCSDQDALERISAAHQGSEISDVVSERRATLRNEACNTALSYNRPQENDSQPGNVRYEKNPTAAELEVLFKNYQTPFTGTDTYMEEHVDYAVDDWLIYVSNEHRIMPTRLPTTSCHLIYQLQKADTMQCNTMLMNLEQYPGSIGLERRMRLELQHLSADILNRMHGCTIAPMGDSIYEWRAVIKGPPRTPYDGGFFQVRFRVTAEYPLRPLQWKFETKIYHPNISSETGDVVPEILDLVAGNRPWCPDATFLSWIWDIKRLLRVPSPYDPCAIESDIAKEFREDRASFNRTAKEWTRIYANFETQDFMSLQPKYEEPTVSRNLVQLQTFLTNNINLCSSLYTRIENPETICDLEKYTITWLDLLNAVFLLQRQLERIRDSRFIDVLGGEEFAKHAQCDLKYMTEKTMFVQKLLNAIESSPTEAKEIVDWNAAATDLQKLVDDISTWRENLEKHLSAKSYEDCEFFSTYGAFLLSGFQNCKEQVTPSADLAFPLR